MQKRVNRRKKELKPTIKILINFIKSSLIGTFVTLLLSFIFSVILSNRPMLNSQHILLVYFVVSVLIGALINGIISSLSGLFKGIISGLISSILYIIIILIFMLIASSNGLNLYCLFLICGIIIFSIVGGIIGANLKRKR